MFKTLYNNLANNAEDVYCGLMLPSMSPAEKIGCNCALTAAAGLSLEAIQQGRPMLFALATGVATLALSDLSEGGRRLRLLPRPGFVFRDLSR